MALLILTGVLALAGCATRVRPQARVTQSPDALSAAHGFHAIGMAFVVRSGPENGPLPFHP